MPHDRENIDSFTRQLRNVMRADVLEQQMKASRARRFRASLVDQPYDGQHDISTAIERARRGRDR